MSDTQDPLPEMPVMPRRGRGRPRKNLRPEELEPQASMDQEQDKTEVEEILEPEVVPDEAPDVGPEPAPSDKNHQETEPMTAPQREMVGEPEPVIEKQLWQVERQSPVTVCLPGDEVVNAKGQQWEFTGAYTKDQIEELIKDHGGRGIYGVSGRSTRTGRMTASIWLVKIDSGEVNIPALLADSYPAKARQLIKAGLLSPEGVLADFADAAGLRLPPETPAPPAGENGEIEFEAPTEAELEGGPSAEGDLLRREYQELLKQQTVEEQKAALASLRRMVHEKAERRKRAEAEVESQINPDADAPVMRRRRRHEEDDEDRPMTRAEREMADLKQQLAAVTAQLANKPQENGMAAVVQMMIESNKANAEVMKEISKSGGANENRNRELMMEIMKISMEKSAAMASQGEKQFETLLKVMEIKEDKRGNDLQYITKLMELGANMSQTGSSEATPWWQELLGGLGQLGGVVADKVRGPQVVQVPTPMPRAANAPAQPQLTAAPAPALPGAVLLDTSQVQSADAVVLPGEQEQAQPQGEESMAPVDPASLKDTFEAVVESILSQKDAKPNAAEWVEVAYQDLPYDYIRQIAQAQDPKELLPLVEPFIGMGLKLKAAAMIQGDPLLVPWLQAGWEDLQAMCREKVATMEPNTAQPQADNVEEGQEA